MKYFFEFEKKSEITLVISNPCGKKKPPMSSKHLAVFNQNVEMTKLKLGISFLRI